MPEVPIVPTVRWKLSHILRSLDPYGDITLCMQFRHGQCFILCCGDVGYSTWLRCYSLLRSKELRRGGGLEKLEISKEREVIQFLEWLIITK